MAVGWSPAGSKSDTILMAMPPSDFSGRAGRCGVHSSPSLCSGLPLSISADSAATVAVTPLEAMVSASSSEMSRPATGLRPAAVRSRAVAAPPIEVPRELRPGRGGALGDLLRRLWRFAAVALAVLRPSFSASRSICSAQSAIEPVSGAAGEFGLRRFGKTPALQRLRRRRGNRSAGCAACRSGAVVVRRGGVFLSGDLAMAGIWEESRPKWKERMRRRTRQSGGTS